MKKFETIKAVGATSHPKMEKLKDILIGYFGSRMQELSEDGDQAKDDTRVMVFSSYRAVVEEIIQKLDEHRPLIRAAAFVGQSADKKGRKGLKQKEQIEVSLLSLAHHTMLTSWIANRALSTRRVQRPGCNFHRRGRPRYW